MTINYCQFISAVSIGGDYGALDYWSRDKHAKGIEIEERGSWVILHILEDGKRSTKRRHVPITNVVYLAYEGAEPAPKGGK